MVLAHGFYRHWALALAAGRQFRQVGRGGMGEALKISGLRMTLSLGGCHGFIAVAAVGTASLHKPACGCSHSITLYIISAADPNSAAELHGM